MLLTTPANTRYKSPYFSENTSKFNISANLRLKLYLCINYNTSIGNMSCNPHVVPFTLLVKATFLHKSTVTWCTAKTQYRKFETNIPRKGIVQPQYQFPHSCVCERFIYSQAAPCLFLTFNTFISFKHFIFPQKHNRL